MLAPPPALYFFLKFSSIPEPIHRRIASAKRGVPALLNRASPLQTPSCQQKQSPYERDAYIIIRTLGLQMGQHPQPTAKKAPSPAATAKKHQPPLAASAKNKHPRPASRSNSKKAATAKDPPPQQQQKKHQQQKASLTKWIGCRKLHDFRPQRNRHDHPVVEGSKMLGFTRSSLTRVWKLQLKSKRFSRLVLLSRTLGPRIFSF